jgi:hypothetical protein
MAAHHRKISAILVGAAFALLSTPAFANVITKNPDLGAYWQPLKNEGTGTFVYANSFVADSTGSVTALGTWLLDLSGANSQQVIFDVVGSNGGAPDMSNVIATTGILDLSVLSTLSFFSANTVSSGVLTSGQTYFFAADVRGLISGDGKEVGGHTQNSGGITDNGTFWYSNDAAGAVFDGKTLIPEMAFSVTIGDAVVPVPEPVTLSLFGAGLVGAFQMRRRKSKA